MSFEHFNLHAPILKAIQACGYTEPTPVQSKAIPAILKGSDVVVSAQTGTGKTAAFVLPALHYLHDQKRSKQPRILILTPTRELAAQITKAASLYGKFQKLNVVSLVGGMSYDRQIKELMSGVDILVATPGRLIDHIERKRIDLTQVQMLILDEADRMLDMGFIEDVEFIAKLTPKDRQTLLFSATVDKKLTQVVRHLLKDPIRIDLSSEKIAAPNIKQILYKANNLQHKNRLLKHCLDSGIYKAIIFSATKINADKLANDLRHQGYAASPLHGDLRQNVRNRTVEQFRDGKVQYLVATDVAARGIDIKDVTHVINYDLPKFSEDYVHRIGRTGRAGKEGVAISFVSAIDAKHVQKIERLIGQKLKLTQLDGVDEKGGSGASEFPAATTRKKFADDDDYVPAARRPSRERDTFADQPYRKRAPRSDESRSHRPDRERTSDSAPRKPRAQEDRPYRERSTQEREPKRFSSSDRRTDSRPAHRDRDGDFAHRKPRANASEDKPYRARSAEAREDKPYRARSSESREDKPYRARSAEGREDKPYRARSAEGREPKRFASDDRRKDSRPFNRDADAPSRKPRTSRDDDKPFHKKPPYKGKSSRFDGDAPARDRKPRDSSSKRPSSGREDRPFKKKEGFSKAAASTSKRSDDRYVNAEGKPKVTYGPSKKRAPAGSKRATRRD